MAQVDPEHPSAEVLLAFSLGRLGDDDLARIADHLAGCASCCARLDGLHIPDELLSALKAAVHPGRDVPEDEGERRRAVQAFGQQKRKSSAQNPPAQGEGTSAPGGPVCLLAEGGPDARSDGLVLPRRVGEYEILEEAGRGGMGVVYKARHLRLGRLAALKVMLAWRHASGLQRRRFQIEAELMARVQHPNIVRLVEAGSHEGQPFMALEWVEGQRLADRLGGAPWPALEAVGLIEMLARAVHAAHGQGVIHRDLKPDNVLLTVDGAPRITDFGLACRVDGCRGLTATGYLVGTPEYMAPEQVQGPDVVIGPAADVYALGVMLYEMLAGRLPFHGDSPMQVLHAVTSGEPPPPRALCPDVPRDLEAITLKCLEKIPALRYRTALALAEDLERFREGMPVAAGPWRRGRRWMLAFPSRPAGPSSLLTALIVVLIALAIVTWKWRQAEQQLQRAEKRAHQSRRLVHGEGKEFCGAGPGPDGMRAAGIVGERGPSVSLGKIRGQLVVSRERSRVVRSIPFSRATIFCSTPAYIRLNGKQIGARI
jgi:serine/threonine protein kinase